MLNYDMIQYEWHEYISRVIAAQDWQEGIMADLSAIQYRDIGASLSFQY